MKAMGMESDASSLGYEIQRLKRSVRTAQLLTLLLGLLVLALLIALAVVGASQHQKISNLQSDVGGTDVYLGAHSSVRNREGATYAGSLFRGSGFWATRAALPGPLSDHSSVAVSDGIFILGGQNVNGSVVSQVLKYDPTLHIYTVMAPMPGPRYRFGATLLDNGKQDTIYVVGGRRDASDNTTAPINELYIYNIPMNTWSIGPAAPMVLSDTCAGSVAGKVYAVGGYDEMYTILNATYVYDPATKVWTKLANMPTARGDLMCVNFLGEIYALGGFYDQAFTANSFADEVESFNPATGAWTSRPNMLTPRGDAGATVLPGNRIMVIGGEGHYQNNTTYKYPKHVNEIYYADDQTWVEKAFIPTARFRTTAASTGGLAYAIGGADLCIDKPQCPSLAVNEVFLDVDHPHVYIYLKNEVYNDTAPITTYPF
ncbi:hypothetical protein KC19_5G002900 [Ceratodon purpureus]|uniref:Attractin/MKLN-like beta-propeller domain-containing protein n=1 Tax=Ceratodon purpureus TaxID=3225 RepID=A0A8T0HX24_CERPU|nr:hypothetical protein KC19_5G002900 [Ceratodon purpureus]